MNLAFQNGPFSPLNAFLYSNFTTEFVFNSKTQFLHVMGLSRL